MLSQQLQTRARDLPSRQQSALLRPRHALRWSPGGGHHRESEIKGLQLRFNLEKARLQLCALEDQRSALCGEGAGNPLCHISIEIEQRRGVQRHLVHFSNEQVPLFTSLSNAVVGRLTESGHLQRLDGRVAPGRLFFARPLLGHVRAGIPQEASQDVNDVLTVDDHLIDEPDWTTLHRVRGDSMKDAGILEGDLVVVEHNAPSHPGDIVLAVVDGDLTVKTLAVDDQKRFFLQPANTAFAAIHSTNSLEIMGVVVGVVMRMRR